ncbi:MAG TPA: transglutaminase-like domain-containing protein [Verrucomicrobiae bacterium]|nr:transglutaminase-like domain-containing protein [Verrucomicrobiae bacterium]
MCLKISRVERTFAYNWAGDQIVPPLVTAARQVPGSKRTSLNMDVREFLAIEHSAEVRHFFLHSIVDRRPVPERERFFVGRPGSFDWRMRCVIEAFGRFSHRPAKERGREAWLLPAETLANGGGDCEDLAFLLVALLGEAGISQSCLRLAFGHLVETHPNGRPRRHAHAWVMYQLEGGAWMILDPMERVDQHLRAKSPVKPAAPVAGATYEYQPLFVFNRDHLWQVHGPKSEKSVSELDTYLGRRRFWKNYDPAFAMGSTTTSLTTR